jgi:hypothetical protein
MDLSARVVPTTGWGWTHQPTDLLFQRCRNLLTCVNLCREVGIPIFYTEATREPSGIDLLTKVHRILPKSREERIKKMPDMRDIYRVGRSVVSMLWPET